MVITNLILPKCVNLFCLGLGQTKLRLTVIFGQLMILLLNVMSDYIIYLKKKHTLAQVLDVDQKNNRSSILV